MVHARFEAFDAPVPRECRAVTCPKEQPSTLYTYKFTLPLLHESQLFSFLLVWGIIYWSKSSFPEKIKKRENRLLGP